MNQPNLNRNTDVFNHLLKNNLGSSTLLDIKSIGDYIGEAGRNSPFHRGINSPSYFLNNMNSDKRSHRGP